MFCYLFLYLFIYLFIIICLLADNADYSYEFYCIFTRLLLLFVFALVLLLLLCFINYNLFFVNLYNCSSLCILHIFC